jgi:hypothetical protein
MARDRDETEMFFVRDETKTRRFSEFHETETRRDRDETFLPIPRDRDETETLKHTVSRPSRDRDFEAEIIFLLRVLT